MSTTTTTEPTVVTNKDKDSSSPEPVDTKAETTASASAAEDHEPEASGSQPGSPENISDTDNTTDEPLVPAVTPTTPANGDWQAIWSPPHNAYYFHNGQTGETTWANPLSTPESNNTDVAPPISSLAAQSSSLYDAQAAAALAQGIDPALAYLDPTLAAGGPSNPDAYTYTAKFNARTGAFAKPDARDPDHVSEYERMKRMSEFYFDVNSWQQDVDARHAAETEEGGKKRKKPTKKDLELFKERKKQRKIAKTAWLRT